MRWKVAILTVSRRGNRGDRGELEDTTAQVIRELVEDELEGVIVDDRVVPDEMDEIMAAMIEMTDYFRADLIFTAGGIGLSDRDVTPEATHRIIDREVPGIAEAIRAHRMKKSSRAMLSREVAGIRGSTLIINLPDIPKGVVDSLEILIEHLPYALSVIHESEPDMG